MHFPVWAWQRAQDMSQPSVRGSMAWSFRPRSLSFTVTLRYPARVWKISTSASEKAWTNGAVWIGYAPVNVSTVSVSLHFHVVVEAAGPFFRAAGASHSSPDEEDAESTPDHSSSSRGRLWPVKALLR